MFDKWKAKQELCKVYKLYDEKSKSLLDSNFYNLEEYEQYEDAKYAIVYMLCEYFDFNYKFYYEFVFSFSNNWSIAYDYIHNYNECERAYLKFLK